MLYEQFGERVRHSHAKEVQTCWTRLMTEAVCFLSLRRGFKMPFNPLG